MSDDEYFLRDDLANLNVDWGAILDAPTTTARPSNVQHHHAAPAQTQARHFPASSSVHPAIAQPIYHPTPQHHQHRSYPSTSAAASVIQPHAHVQHLPAPSSLHPAVVQPSHHHQPQYYQHLYQQYPSTSHAAAAIPPHVHVQQPVSNQTNRTQPSNFRPAAPQAVRIQPQPAVQSHPAAQPQQPMTHVYHTQVQVPAPVPVAVAPPQVVQNPVVSPASSHYFDDDDDILDSSFFAELDRVERYALANSANTSVNPATTTTTAPRPNVQAQPHAGPSGPSAVNAAQRMPNIATTGAYSSTLAANQQIHARPPQPQHRLQRTASEYELYGTQHDGNTQAPNPTFNANNTKRPRSEDSISITFSPRKKGKMKAEENELSQVVADYEDELSCPICCDLFVAAHSANPCGHTFCGECGWQWQSSPQNPKRGCPVCRQKMDKKTPMIPNLAIDNIVEKHVKALATTNKEDWAVGRPKHQEWLKRKQAWRDGAAKRAKKSKPATRPVAITNSINIDVFGGPSQIVFVDNEEEDSTYEDSDVELIPRPIQRPRRNTSRVHLP